MKMADATPKASPRWGVTLKIVVGLSFAIGIGALVVTFRSIIGPLLLAVILAYFLHPLAVRLSTFTRLNWRASVSFIFLLLLVVIAGLFTALGVAVVGQIESLINLVQNFVNNMLPQTLENLANTNFALGPWSFDFSQFEVSSLIQQGLNNLQSVIGQATGVINVVFTSAVGIVGWTAFVVLVSYFVLADAGRVPDALRFITIPGYDYDIRRLSRELGRTWNIYLRGQFFIILMVIISAWALFSILGLRYSLAIALLTGVARFIPYIGPITTNIITFVVAIFQSSNYFNLEPLYYALLVVGLAIVFDQIYDNVITPRILGESLGVHPAAVLIAALILAQSIGFVGLVLAAPVLASLRLLIRYMGRKMFDLDPWPEPEETKPAIVYPWQRFSRWLETRTGKTDSPSLQVKPPSEPTDGSGEESG